MTLRQYLFLMLATTMMCWLGFAGVVRGVDPMSGGWMALTLFYLSLTLALTGTIATIGTMIRARIHDGEAPTRHVARGLRQSLILTALFIGALAFQSRQNLSWGRFVLLLGLAVMAEVILANVSNRKPA